LILETILFSILGVLIGLPLGLLPGMHINNILPLILSLSFLFTTSHNLSAFIISIAITQIFVSFIPSIFLGAPDENTALSVLPGHRLLFEGKGYEAIKLTVIGGIGSLISCLFFLSIFAGVFGWLYEISRPYIHFVILSVVILMIFTEKKLKKIFSAALIFGLSGILGIFALNSSVLSQQQILFPILSGLFGLSTLFVSISQKSKIPEQTEDDSLKISNRDIFKSILLGTFAGLIVGLLPAIGVSQAATMVQYLGRAGEARNFLVTLSGINVANEVFSLISLYLVGNPRSGASVAIQKILVELTFFDVAYIIGVICLTSGIAAALTLFLGKKIPKFLEKLNYKAISLSIIIFIISMVFLFLGIIGLLILFTSVAIGLLCAYLGIRRSHCMGCLLVPSVLFFSGLNPLVISILGI
jgi:putative membrane protein